MSSAELRIRDLAERICQRLKRGGKIYVCGNGGSAAQAQHFTAELMGRYIIDRAPIPAVSLHTDTSLMTAIANDFGYGAVFERQVTALMSPVDVLICLSTSGKSENVVRAMDARPPGAFGVAFVGRDAKCPLALAADWVDAFEFEDSSTAVIQETHLTKLHDLAGFIEAMVVDARLECAS